MKKIIILLMIVYINSFAQDFNLSVTPSSFYTYGNYNKKKTSQSYSAYASFAFNYYDLITLGYDNTIINDKAEFKYKQDFFLISGLKNLFPYYIKFNYGYLDGSYDYKPYKYTYKDFTNIYNVSFLRYFDGFYSGLSYSHINVNGHKATKINQLQLIFDWITLPQLIVSYRGIYTTVKSDLPIYEEFLQGETSDDDRKLFSNNISLNYYASLSLFLRAEISTGKRAYFFNTDYLTFFNQDDTQNLSFLSKIDYELFSNFRINFTYQYLTLDHSKINYYSLGLRYYVLQLM